MIDIQKWKDKIDDCEYDSAVGIRIARLANFENFSTFITEIAPHKSVTPHYHKNGEEHYHIISGFGKISLKNVATGNQISYNVSKEQSFVVPANVEHQLLNVGDEPLLLMFSCPSSHLDTDRYFLQDS